MKVKHYLSKAKREYFEKTINYWYRQKKIGIMLENESSIRNADEMKLLYIEYVTWCGFKVSFNNKIDGYIITK